MSLLIDRGNGSFIGINTNIDAGTPAAYYETFLARHMPAAPWVVFREGFDDGPKTAGETGTNKEFQTSRRRMGLDWVAKVRGGLLWQANLEEVNPWPGGMSEDDTPLSRYGIAPGAEGDARVWDDVRKPDNARYRVAQMAKALPNAYGANGLWGILGPNEMGLNPERVCWKYDIETCSGAERSEMQALSIARHVALARAVWEELRSAPRYLDRPHGALLFPATGTEWWMPNDATTTTMRFKSLLAYNGGEIARYIDAWATTFHHQPGYWTEAPASTGERSIANMWAALTAFHASYPEIARKPVCATEYGCGSQFWGIDGGIALYPWSEANEWQTDGTNLFPADGTAANGGKTRNGKIILRTYKLGLHALYAWYWSLAFVSIYSLTASGAQHKNSSAGNSFEGANGTENFIEWSFADPATASGRIEHQPAWNTLQRLWDPVRYAVPADGRIAISAKNWAYDPNDERHGFHLPESWAVTARVFLAWPSGAPQARAMATPPWVEWTLVQIEDGLIRCLPFTATTAPGLTASRVCRPVLLSAHRHGAFRIRCEASCSAGGQARLMARGFDALDGLASVQSAAAAAEWTPLEVSFTTRPHNVPGLPNAARAVIVLRHNGIGTAQFRNVQVLPA